MALARVKYTQSTSGNRNFTVTFPYISRDHVKVSVNDQPVSFTWTNNATVILDTAPLLGDIVDVYRVTERNNLLVDFNDGSTLTESQLQLSASQSFYIAQEAFDVSNTALSTAFDDMYFAGGRRIRGLGNAVEPQDALTKGQSDERFANDVITQTGGHWDAKGLQLRSLDTRTAPTDNDAMNFRAVKTHVANALNNAEAPADSWQRVRWVDTIADLHEMVTGELMDGQQVSVKDVGLFVYETGGWRPQSVNVRSGPEFPDNPKENQLFVIEPDALYYYTGSQWQLLVSDEHLQSYVDAASAQADRAEGEVAAGINLGVSQVTSFATQEANRAETARDAAFVNADVYPDVATGIAAVAEGEQFQVVEGDEIVRYRRDSSTTHTEMGRYLSARGVQRVVSLPTETNRHMAILARPATDPKFGWVRGSPVQGANANPATYVLSDPTVDTVVINRVELFSTATLGTIEVAAYSRAGDTFTRERILATITTKSPSAVNIFDSFDFDPFIVLAGEYLGFAQSSGFIAYTGSNTTSLGYFNSIYANRAVFTDTEAFFGAAPQIGFYSAAQSGSAGFLSSLAASASRSNTILNQITESYSERLGAEGSVPGSSSSFSGTFIVGKPSSSYGIIDSCDIGIANGTGSVFVTIFDRMSEFVFRPAISKEVPVVPGNNPIELGMNILEGQYVGVVVPTGIEISTATTSVGHDGYFSSNRTGKGAVQTSLSVSSMDRRIDQGFTLTLESAPEDSEIVPKPWEGKTLVTFGDSITWYNGRPFSSTHLEVGQIAKGYQSYVVEEFGCTLDNQGRSGWTMPEIFASNINSYDFSGAYAVSITSGANDHRKAVPVGDVLPIGSEFNVATFAGAMQASVEKVIQANKETKIFLITPVKGWYTESGTSNVPGPYNGEMVISVDYVDAIKAIGALYSLPVIDWYHEVGFNDLNKSYYLGDNPDVFTAYLLHPNQKGFKRMGEMLVGALRKY